MKHGKSTVSLIFILSLILGVIPNPRFTHAEHGEESIDLILDSAEKFFISLRVKDYRAAWDLLSEESHEKIIDDVYKDSKKMGLGIEKKTIIKDFKSNGAMFSNYWIAFHNNFDPDMILEQSRWEMGFIKKNQAEIIITYKKSENPAILKMFKEGGMWRVGLVETFWTRKY